MAGVKTEDLTHEQKIFLRAAHRIINKQIDPGSDRGISVPNKINAKKPKTAKQAASMFLLSEDEDDDPFAQTKDQSSGAKAPAKRKSSTLKSTTKSLPTTRKRLLNHVVPEVVPGIDPDANYDNTFGNIGTIGDIRSRRTRLLGIKVLKYLPKSKERDQVLLHNIGMAPRDLAKELDPQLQPWLTDEGLQQAKIDDKTYNEKERDRKREQKKRKAAHAARTQALTSLGAKAQGPAPNKIFGASTAVTSGLKPSRRRVRTPSTSDEQTGTPREHSATPGMQETEDRSSQQPRTPRGKKRQLTPSTSPKTAPDVIANIISSSRHAIDPLVRAQILRENISFFAAKGDNAAVTALRRVFEQVLNSARGVRRTRSSRGDDGDGGDADADDEGGNGDGGGADADEEGGNGDNVDSED